MAKAAYDREDIINRSIELFWRHGFNGSSMQQVVDTTGLKPGSIYYSFGNKEALFKEALGQYARKRIEKIRRTLDAAPDVGEGIRLLLDQMAEEAAGGDFKSCFLVKTQLELGLRWRRPCRPLPRTGCVKSSRFFRPISNGNGMRTPAGIGPRASCCISSACGSAVSSKNQRNRFFRHCVRGFAGFPGRIEPGSLPLRICLVHVPVVQLFPFPVAARPQTAITTEAPVSSSMLPCQLPATSCKWPMANGAMEATI